MDWLVGCLREAEAIAGGGDWEIRGNVGQWKLEHWGFKKAKERT
jgi:hypothetical protein